MEEWESGKTEADMEKYVWEMTQSKPSIIRTVQHQKLCHQQVCIYSLVISKPL